MLEALDQPRASFAGNTLETPWSALQLAYFVGTAMWTYLTQPFTFTQTGFQTTELEPWAEAGQHCRRSRAVAERFGAARNSQHERGKSSRVLVGLDVARSLRSRNDDVSNSSRVWKVWRASAAMAGSVQVQ